MSEAAVKAAARAAIKAGMVAAYGRDEADYDEYAGAMEQAFWDAFDAGGGGTGGSPARIAYGSHYPSSSSNASSTAYDYFLPIFGSYCYFYANTVYANEAMRNMPIPGPGSVKQIWIQTVNLANTKTTPSILQLRKNNADVAGAAISIPAGAAVQRHTHTGDWPFNDLDEMCFKFSVTSAGNLYVKHLGMIVELS